MSIDFYGLEKYIDHLSILSIHIAFSHSIDLYHATKNLPCPGLKVSIMNAWNQLLDDWMK